MPEYEEKIKASAIGHFIHLCLVRALREDRAALACKNVIDKVLGPKYTTPVNDKIEELFEESTPDRPMLYLLFGGSDPT